MATITAFPKLAMIPIKFKSNVRPGNLMIVNINLVLFRGQIFFHLGNKAGAWIHFLKSKSDDIQREDEI